MVSLLFQMLDRKLTSESDMVCNCHQSVANLPTVNPLSYCCQTQPVYASEVRSVNISSEVRPAPTGRGGMTNERTGGAVPGDGPRGDERATVTAATGATNVRMSASKGAGARAQC